MLNTFHEVRIKPFSVNKVWQGRRYLTRHAKQFKENLTRLLMTQPRRDIPAGDLCVHYVFGITQYKRSDVDNFIKTTQDVICEYYSIDDKRFVAVTARKVRVKKGDEFIRFAINRYDANVCPLCQAKRHI